MGTFTKKLSGNTETCLARKTAATKSSNPALLAEERWQTTKSRLECGCPEERRRMLCNKDVEGKTLLHHAAESGEEAKIHDLLAFTPSPADWSSMLLATSVESFTPFYSAARTPLHAAASRGKAGAVRTLLQSASAEQRTVMLRAEDDNGYNPFLLTPPLTFEERWQTAATLLDFISPKERHTMLCAKDSEGKTLLHRAAETGEVTKIKALLALATDPADRTKMLSATTAHGWTPLHFAASRAYSSAITALMEQLTVEERNKVLRLEDSEGCTAFLVALQRANQSYSAATALLLLKLSTPEEFGAVPAQQLATALLQSAVKYRAEVRVQVVLALAVNSEDRRRMLAATLPNRWTWLHAASHDGVAFCTVLELATEQVRSGMLRAWDHRARTALQCVALWDGKNRSAVWSWKDHTGKTLLHHAAENGGRANIEAFLKLAENPRECSRMLIEKDALGWTALHRAACLGHESACKALLSSARTVAERTKMLAERTEEGCTALEFAKASGFKLD